MDKLKKINITKILYIILPLLMMALVIGPGLRSKAATIASGSCGTGVNWSVSSYGTLSISGSGAMNDYKYSSAPWYSYQSDISSITIGSGVTHIGNYAFSGLANLNSSKTISLPNTVTSIGDYAFNINGSSGSGIFTIVLPASLKSVGSSPFGYSVEKLTYSGTVEQWCAIDFAYYIELKPHIGGSQFSGDLDLSGLTKIGSYAVANLGTNITSIILPNGITEIPNGAFRGTAITAISIPSTVTSIGSEAFEECKNLVDVNFGASSSLRSIGEKAFENCSKIVSFTVPEGVEIIEQHTFANCSSLTSIIIPTSLTSVKYGAFSNAKINKVYISNINKWMSVDLYSVWDNPMYNGATLYLNNVIWSGDLTFASGTTTVKPYIFSGCKNLKSVTIPSSVTQIGASTFNGCSNLEKVTFKGTVSKIGEDAFKGCTGVNKLDVASIDSWFKMADVYECRGLIPIYDAKKELYVNGSAIRSVTVPSTITFFSRQLKNVTNIETVVIPDTVTSISEAALAGCSSLKKLTIPFVGAKRFEVNSSYSQTTYPFGYIFGKSSYDGSYEVGQMGLSYSKGSSTPSSAPSVVYYIPNSLEEIVFTGDSIPNYAFEYISKLKKVSLEASSTKLGSEAFYYCSSLASISINGKLGDVYTNSFNGCHALTGVYIKNIDDWCDSYFRGSYANPLSYAKNLYVNGVLAQDITIHAGIVRAYVFEGCRSITSVTLGNEVTSLYNDCFKDCTSLSTVKMGSGISRLTSSIFSGCTGLKNVTLPSGLTELSGVFSGCSALDSIELPGTLTKIGYNTFSNCTSLKEITIPSSVTSIDSSAFYRDKLTANSDCNVAFAFSQYGGTIDWNKNHVGVGVLKADGVTYECSACHDDLCQLKMSVEGYETEHPYTQEDSKIWTIHEDGASDIIITFSEDTYFDDGYDFLTIAGSAGLVDGENEFGYTGSELAGRTIIVHGDTVTIELAVEDISEGGYGFAITDITVNKHTFTGSGDVVLPGCVEQGYTIHTCDICSVEVKDSYVAAKGHVEADVVRENIIEATCIKAGSYDSVVYCSVCEAELTNEKVEIEALGHDYIDTVVKPTCTAQGYTSHECSRCDESYTDSYTDMVAHSWDDGTVVKTAVGTEKGIIRYGCTECDAFYEEDIQAPYIAINETLGDDITWSINKDGMLVIEGTGAIPDFTEGSTNAWKAYSDEIVSIQINGTITRVGAYAFSGLQNLVSFTSSITTLTEIGDYAFADCDSLIYNLRAPSRITSIGDFAFKNDVSISSVIIGTYVTNIGEGAFYGCSGIGSLTVSGSNKAYAASANVLYSADKSTIVEVCNYSLGEIIIPENIVSISNYAFAGNTGVKKIIFEGDAPAIGTSAFVGTELTAVYDISTSGWADVIKSTYGGTVTWKMAEKEIASLSIETAPTKTAYVCNENISLNGLVAKIIYVDGTYREVGAESLVADKTVASYGNTTVSLSYTSADEAVYSASFDIIVAHDYEKSVTAATCTVAGSNKYTCRGCDDTYTEAGDAALGHDCQVSVTKASCTVGGYTETTCSRCDYYQKSDVTEALGHTPETDQAVVATCTEKGKTEGSHCAVCKEVLEAQEETEALGHISVVDARIEPTCTENGKTEGSHCSVCNEVLVAQNDIEKIGHSFGEWEEIAAPTCEGEGSRKRVCSKCEYAETENIDANGHDWQAEYTVDKNNDCTTDGSKSIHCNNCSATKDNEVIPATGHTEVVDEGKAPTCTEEGLSEGKHCSVCNVILTEQVAIAASGHKMVTDAAIAPTLTTTGKTEGSHCEICGEVFVEQQDVPSLMEGVGFYGYSLSLFEQGNLGINYFVKVPHDVDSNSLLITVKSGDEEIARVALDDNNLVDYCTDSVDGKVKGYYIYKIQCPVTSTQMSDVYSASLVVAADQTIVVANASTSVKSYAEVLLHRYEAEGKTADSKDVKLLKALLNYGAYSQEYFGHNSSDMANSILSDSDKQVSGSDYANYIGEMIGTVSGIEYVGSSIVLNSDFTIRHYFNIAAGQSIDSYGFKVNGEILNPVNITGQLYYVDITGINAGAIDHSYSLIITKQNEKMVLVYSVMSYMAASQNVTGNGNLHSLVDAIYAYGRAYNEYLAVVSVEQ